MTISAVHVTEHAFDRGKERLGLSRSAMERQASRVFEVGRKPRDFKGRFRRYLDGLQITHRSNGIRVHGETVFVFDDTRLVTVFRVPNEIKRGIRP